jgi:Ca-activated chloride channel family protein
MLELAWPWILGTLIAPLVVAWTMRGAPTLARGAVRLPFFESARHWTGGGRRRRRSAVLAVGAWIALVAAAARPQWIAEPVSVPLSGRDLMLAIDVSGSMAATDMRLDGATRSRLAAVKRIGGEFVARRAGDRLGLIVFGSRAYVHVPLTFDHATVRALLEQSVVGLAGTRTAIGEAIGLALKRLRERPASSRVLILLTDGANTAGRLTPLEAARLAAAHGLRVYTVGVGRAGAGDDGLALDEPTLRAVAERTGGRYFAARDTEGLVDVYRRLDALEPVTSGVDRLRPVEELFHWPLAIACLLACAGAGMVLRRGARS